MLTVPLDEQLTLRVWEDWFAKGTYASVHAGDILRGFQTFTVAVKVQRWAHQNFQQELKLQSRLWDATRYLKCAASVLPVYAQCMLFDCPAVVMPLVDGSVYQLLGETKSQLRRGKIVRRMSENVAQLLKVLQRKFNFMHRDLHCSNVFYNVDGDPLAAPITSFKFYVGDFGNAVCFGDSPAERQDSAVLNGLQRRRHFSRFNPGLDLNTLILSTREFLSESLQEVPRYIRKAISYFLRKASQSNTYTADGREMLRKSMFLLGKDIDDAACNPVTSVVPLFWFSYAGASSLHLPNTNPAAICKHCA